MIGQVTIEGRSYGEIDAGQQLVHGTYQNPEGLAFWCPACGRVWAEIRFAASRTWVYHIPCRQHHSEVHFPGGSIWLNYLPHITDAFNEEILRYEALRAVELYDQQAPSESSSDLPL